MQPRPSVLLALLVVLSTLPSAAAFPATTDAVHVAYPSGRVPTAIATGALEGEGVLAGALFAVGLEEAVFRAVPTLILTEVSGGSPRETTFHDADLVVHSGTLRWQLQGGGLTSGISAPYGVAMTLPQAPGSVEGDEPLPGFLMGGVGLAGDFRREGGATEILLLDAVVSLRERGQPVEGWARRDVNRGLGPEAFGGQGSPVLFSTQGDHAANLPASLVGAAFETGSSLTLRIRQADRDEFAASLQLLGSAAERLGGQQEGSSPFAEDGPLSQLARLSTLFNGALLLLPAVGVEPVEPDEARLGSEPLDIGAFSLLRSQDVDLVWGEDHLRVQGRPKLALTSAGFAVPERATFGGLVPVLSAVLWLAALGAIAIFLVKRPAEAKGVLAWRLAGAGAALAAFLVAFWLWDRSFHETFGTSFLTLLAQEGVSAASWLQLGLVLSVQMVPWGVTALFFALPVRIGLGVALRYLGKGKSLKGFAKAAGLLVLGVVGPAYALWIVNLLLGLAARYVDGAL